MSKREKLLDFFRLEIQLEEQSGFSRLGRVPDSRVSDKLKHYKTLSEAERDEFKECAAQWSYSAHAYVVDAPEIDHKQHPYYDRWLRTSSTMLDSEDLRDVRLLRAMVQQYKIDKHRGVRSHVTDRQFAYASSIRSVKAPELRRRVRAVLKPLGLSTVDALGNYHCQLQGRELSVNLDFAGRDAQLRYFVSVPEFTILRPHHRLVFEQALGGFGHGHWNFIIEENVDEVFVLFRELVRYSFELPQRIRLWVA